MIKCLNHSNRIASNKKYQLCAECMYIKKHGESRHKAYMERAKAKSPKIYVLKRQPIKPKKNYKLKQATFKQQTINQALSELKKEIELEALQSNEYFCKGCGCSNGGLDKSHILSIGQYKQFELVKRNIQLLCRECHMKWESGNIAIMSQLNCFQDNLDIVKSLNEQAYESLSYRYELFKQELL
jgi:5-methylcytosine-specific restriction endonuclease McrA